ncbi:MAG: calcium/proton exchanger [Chloroflexi bacterium]|nr:calcium/proton exchanger [Chloroflexota bacterium]
MKYLYLLLLLVPVAIGAKFLHASPILVFFISALAIVPLAGILGDATEELAIHTGPRLGGLLNATLGNAAELIITIAALRIGLLDLVKASITGSILGNILLVLGTSALLGGLRHGTQTFNRRSASGRATIMILAVIMLAIPALFFHAVEYDHRAANELSVGVAAIMIILYGLYLTYAFRFEQHIAEEAAHETPVRWSIRLSLAILVVSTIFIAWLSEILVGAVEPVVAQLGVTEFFLGVILIPIVGNVAEHVVAVEAAIKNQMELSMEISLGSSLQIALFVAPLLVFLSLFLSPEPLNLIFNRFELGALGGAVFIAALASEDGETNWLEGAELLAVYLVLAMAFFLLPV